MENSIFEIIKNSWSQLTIFITLITIGVKIWTSHNINNFKAEELKDEIKHMPESIKKDVALQLGEVHLEIRYLKDTQGKMVEKIAEISNDVAKLKGKKGSVYIYEEEDN